jgi:protein ImuB
MRIACVYLPSFPLQAHVRQAPHLAGTSLAVADGVATGSSLVACSRAAWADGIRPGMAVATARAIVPELEVVTGDSALYQRALDAVVESLMAISEVIDTGAGKDALASHRAIYMKVPPRSRGTSFGQRVLTQLSRQGFRARVGVADDRFTAYVAAVRVEHRGKTSRLDDPSRQPPLFHQSCTSVSRGGSAAFLAPLPLSYLPIDPDVMHLLETCGVKTLGDFAALPPPSVSRDWIDEDSDFQALARGQGSATLRGQSRDEIALRPLVERLEMDHELGDSQPLLFALRTLCERVSQRLAGRERAARQLCLCLLGPGGQVTRLELASDQPAMSSAELFASTRDQLAASCLMHPVVAMELEVTRPAEPAALEIDLFSHNAAPEQMVAAPGMATQKAAAFHQAEGARAAAGASHWPRRGKRARRASRAQQRLSFFE